MAQKDLKLLWGSNTKMHGNNAPAVVDGKAYFAIIDGNTKYPDTAAPANEAFIYLDKDSTRYNVIAKRAIFDALGNKINSTYATDIESSGNTMSLFSEDGNTEIDTAKIINSAAIGQGTTHNGTTYHLKVTVNGVGSADYALVAASGSKAGIVTTDNQTFAGIKTFSNNTASSSKTTGAVVITGGLGVGGSINGGAAISAATTLTAGTSATIGTTLTTGGAASIGGDLTVVGKDIFFGNTAGKIVALSANDDGNQITLGNTASNTFNLKLVNNSSDSNSIELYRGTNASWKIKNDAFLHIQSNYTTEVGDYYDILKLEYNTGNATIKGTTSVDTLTIRNSDAIAHIAFSRGDINYITAPTSGKIAFVANGAAISSRNSSLIISDTAIYPGKYGTISLGSWTNVFKNVYTKAVTGTDDLTLDCDTDFSIIFTQNGDTEIARITDDGMTIKHIHPPTNNASGCTLGNSSLYWNHVYSTNFTGTTFTGTTFTGNAASATQVYVTNTTPTTSTTYYLTYATGNNSNQNLRCNDDLTYIDSGTTSILKVGCSSHKGQLELRDGSTHYVIFDPQNLTANRVIQISDHGGIMMTSGNYTQWASPSTHTHNVTISHTPAGTISRPTFTGTANQETVSMAGTTSVSKGDHTHSYNRVSSVSAHTLNTGTYTSSSNSGSGVAFYAYPGSSKPSLTASITSKCLTVTFTSPATIAYTAAPNSHTHTYNRVSSINNHTVSTSSYTTGATPTESRVDVASNGHKHTYTAAGTISIPTFTGTAYSTTETTTTQNV